MAEKSDDRNLMVEFTAEGQVRPSVRAAEHLGKLSGLWRLVPEVGQMMLLERVGSAQEQPQSERHVTLAGTFATNNDLHNALSMISMGQQDGAFHVTNGDHHKILYFRRGVLLSARSSLPEDRLGNLLVKVEMLSSEDLDKCLPEVRAGQPLGTVLVSKGVMTTAQVYDGLRRQAEEIFFSILPWPSGAFYLVGPLQDDEVPAQLHLDTNGLLMDGVRRLDEGEGESDDDDSDLRRLEPVSAADLPTNGPELIVETYNKALRVLFSSVGEETAKSLHKSVGGFISDSLPFHELFFGVEIDPSGELTSQAIIDNIGQDRSEATIRNMQLGLSEILFFALFAAGEEVTTELEREIQHEVATELRGLPHAARRDAAIPRAATESETSRVDLSSFAARAEARSAQGKPAAPPAAKPEQPAQDGIEPIDDEMIAGIFDDEGAEGLSSGEGLGLGATGASSLIGPEDELLLDDSDSNTENSVIAAIVDEEFSVEDLIEDSGATVDPVAGSEHSEPILLGKEAPASSASSALDDDSFELSLDQDEEIMSLLDKVTEAKEEEARALSQAGPLPNPPPRSPSSEFDRMLSENGDEDGPEEPVQADESNSAQ